MINEKELSPESADLIGQYVCLHGMLYYLFDDSTADIDLSSK